MIRCSNQTCSALLILHTSRSLGREQMVAAALEEEGWMLVHNDDGPRALCPRCKKELTP